MQPRTIVYGIFLCTILALIIGGSFTGIWLISAKDAELQKQTVEKYGTPKTLPPHTVTQKAFTESTTKYNDKPVICKELKDVANFQLTQLSGGWVLQEKLEFGETNIPHVAIARKNQTSMCIRIDVTNIVRSNAIVLISLHIDRTVLKNFTGYIKLQENGYWDFHMLEKEHNGIIIDAVPNKYFVFVECVSGNSRDAESVTPNAVFVFTKGVLLDTEMDNIRIRTESTLRHKDETFVDFGSYCF